MNIEMREAQLLDFAAEQRETDRNYYSQPVRNQKNNSPDPCEKFLQGKSCSCAGCAAIQKEWEDFYA
jgi:hypothetical protein